MSHELRVAATIENVRHVSDFVRDAAKRERVSADVLFDIDVAVEEACTNIVRHAYGPDQAGDIVVQVEARDGDLCITLTDWGRPFEVDAADLAVDVPVEVRAEGGMGVLLMYELMDDVTRSPATATGGPNVLTMIKHIGR